MISIYKKYDLVNNEYKHILDFLKFNKCHMIYPHHIHYVYDEFKRLNEIFDLYI